MDPTRQLHTPVAEIRAQAPMRDEFGEAWIVIDGIETKVPSIKQARALLAKQDALRVQIRADLDAKGIRFNPDGSDREEQVEITLDDGTKTTVGLMKPGDANYMQIGSFPDAEGLLKNAEIAQIKREAEERQKRVDEERAKEAARLIEEQIAFDNLPWYKKIFGRRPQ